MKKKGQMKLSFGMIFSIILIIVFISLAVYVIYKLVGIQKNAEIGMFVTDLQEHIDALWNSPKGLQEQDYRLPSKINSVCFTETSEVFFKPRGSGGSFEYTVINHVDIEEEFCIENINGEIKINLEKKYDEVLVRITG